MYSRLSLFVLLILTFRIHLYSESIYT